MFQSFKRGDAPVEPLHEDDHSGVGSRKMRPMLRPVLLLVLCLLTATFGFRLWLSSRESQDGVGPRMALASTQQAQFDFSNLKIPREAIRSGGPPKDGIPALSSPAVIPAGQATYLRADDRVVGVALNGAARAYPLKIIVWHELVNDRLGGVPLLVTYCPLCDSAMVFDRRLSSGVAEFGVSGLLYNSNVLMYQRGPSPEPLWSQAMAMAVSGPRAGEQLRAIPFELTTWRAWKSRHPGTDVLSSDTGYARGYTRNPYARYFAGPQLMFPVQPLSDELPPKEPVLGVRVGDATRAYPLSELAQRNAPLEATLNGRAFTITYDRESESARIVQSEEGVTWMYGFWFAWHAFHPETEVYQARR